MIKENNFKEENIFDYMKKRVKENLKTTIWGLWIMTAIFFYFHYLKNKNIIFGKVLINTEIGFYYFIFFALVLTIFYFLNKNKKKKKRK